MKFPKNRANLYLVVRTGYQGIVAVTGAFSEPIDADNYKDACAQEWFDKAGELTGVEFEVVLTTFYG